jgi:hypothetical protein
VRRAERSNLSLSLSERSAEALGSHFRGFSFFGDVLSSVALAVDFTANVGIDLRFRFMVG